ncbi:MAG TPA: FmdB family zinc ribbon protein [Candidatus Dormibacteraeota bacterium]|nr:FmdB family zinc ribbon protein [Candidatus Dormibacteraeota bacterium]
MPIYGYRCSDCGHQFEIHQRMSDEPLKVCPKCQGKLTKVLYPAGVIFKGSGFYTTDYKGSANGSTSSSETKTETKTESKPESKSGSND